MVNMPNPEETEAGDGAQPAKRMKLGANDGDLSDQSDAGDELPKEISDALDQLDVCQRDLDKVNEQASEDILKVEKRYNVMRKPLFAKRAEAISKIPQFWLTAFSNHPHFVPLIEVEDEKFLHHLRDVVVEENEDIKSGYKIKFTFEENPFFENLELVKDVHLPYGLTHVAEENETEQKPLVSGIDIKWKKGMDLMEWKEKRAKKKKRDEEAGPSFLEWLVESGDPSMDEISEVIKDDLWANPMQYYLSPEIDYVENGDEEDDEENGSEPSEDDDEVGFEEEEDDDETG